jgi:hypothetical protein
MSFLLSSQHAVKTTHRTHGDLNQESCHLPEEAQTAINPVRGAPSAQALPLLSQGSNPSTSIGTCGL